MKATIDQSPLTPSPLSHETPLSRLVSLIRVSSTGQLDLPTVHTASINQFVQLFPDTPAPAQYQEDLIQALLLALEFQIVAVSRVVEYVITWDSIVGYV